jgi:hypothetical protein
MASPLGLASPPGLVSTLGAEVCVETDGAWTDGLAPGVQAARAAAIARIAISRLVIVNLLVASPECMAAAASGHAEARGSVPTALTGDTAAARPGRCEPMTGWGQLTPPPDARKPPVTDRRLAMV